MKRMSKLQPIMKDMKEKYKDNPQKLNQETMKLYREYGVNPMGGCLPMLVQIPIFFGVFNMINAAVELRGQPFFWVSDLSQPDRIAEIAGIPINLLPILMAVTMVLQMRMTPQTGDKLQRRIFMLMPLMFFFFCYNYASALALYWTTQNIVSIGQTYLTHRMPEPELQKKSSKPGKDGVVDVESSTPRKKGFMERMAEKMEEIHKEREAAAGNTPAKKQEQLTHKQVVRARTGRRLTLKMMMKMARTFNFSIWGRLTDEERESFVEYFPKHLFNYSKGFDAAEIDKNAALYEVIAFLCSNRFSSFAREVGHTYSLNTAWGDMIKPGE